MNTAQRKFLIERIKQKVKDRIEVLRRTLQKYPSAPNYIFKAFFILLISSCLLVSCTQEKSTSINENPENRIKLKEFRIIDGYRYSIIEVDSVEYLTQSEGGFVRLSK